jgi:lipopolysaccharide transport system permease protein
MNKWVYYRDLISVLTEKEIKVRYKSTFFGFLWSIANPLCFALVFFIAFKIYMRVQIPNYIAFLLSGLFPWQCFANSVNTAPWIFLNNANLIKKVKFPRITLPLALVNSNLLQFLFSIPVLIFFLIIHKINPSFFEWFIGIPLLVFFTLLITIGVTLIVSSLNLFFRDLEHITVIVISLFFYFTPIIYSESMVPKAYRMFLLLNPFSPLIISWRNLFMENLLETKIILAAFFWVATIFLVGFGVYKKLELKFAEVI